MKRLNSIPVLVAALAVSLAACSPLREAMEGHQEAVARAAGYSLTIEKAADFVDASVPRVVVPSNAVINSTVNLWISYALLATEFASPDEFSDVNVEPIIRGSLARAIIRQLHDDVIVAQIDSSDAVLRPAYEREQPFLRVEAYHILISTSGASGAELDSLRQLAEDIRERAAAGEDFGQLAREYSQDPTSAPQGGYLGWVSRGRLLRELDLTIFATQPGEVSETVRSMLGYHIVKVTDVDSPNFEAARDGYRRMYVLRRIVEMEEAYLDSLSETADLGLAPGATSTVKRLARTGGPQTISRVSRAAVLARYRGGVFTVADWSETVMREGPATLRLYSVSDSAYIDDLLMEMARDKLILTVATELGYAISDDEHSSQIDAGYRDLRTVARQAGFQRQGLAEGEENTSSAIERAVRNALEYRTQAVALGRVSMPLWRKQTVQVHPDRYAAVRDRVLAIRGLESQERGE